MKLNSYKDLIVWQKAIELVKEIYQHISTDKALQILEEVQKMLTSMIVKLNPKR